MTELLKDFINLSKEISMLWKNIEDPDLDNKIEELDKLLASLKPDSKDLLEIEKYVENKKDNYFEKVNFARYYIRTKYKEFKAKEIYEYVAKKDKKGMAGFLAKNALYSME